MAELERERAAVVEIDKCDPKALAEVKSSIADNATQLKMLEEEVADVRKDIDSSNKRGEDFRVEQKTLQQKIDNASKMIFNSITPQDLFGQTKGTWIPWGYTSLI
jgi:septal ring factor EnvC (AmiA/AmiB activator)